MGEPLAKEILLAGRILNAEEALAVRLVTEVHAADALIAAAHALADRITAQDPHARCSTRSSLIHAPREAHPVADNEAQAVLFESEQKFARMTASWRGRNDERGCVRRDRGWTRRADRGDASASRRPDRVGVVGGGRMGVGIAHAFLLAGAARAHPRT